jgi:HlyD family secretion protein
MFRPVGAWIRRHPILSLVLIMGVGLTSYLALRPKPITYEYVLAAVERGEVTSRVTASGKLRALNTIKVGAEVSGQVMRVYVDFNSPVKAGQVLAEIDPTRFRARMQQVQAQVALAQASLMQAEAGVTRSQTDIQIQEREYARRRDLTKRGFFSKAGLDAAASQLASARAATRTSAAQVASARAQIAQSTAELASAQLDLRRTIIVAPASGVVINKLVEPGTTVAASFQTPNLFEIAADTTRMQVEASVDEADIGQIQDGQKVSFTVDAYPNSVFPAFVRQIRKAATENQNVVSYLVILEVDNGDGRLLPGMTANVEVITGAKTDTLRIPTPALRFRPRESDRPEEKKTDNDKQPDPSKDKLPDPVVWVATSDPYKPARRHIVLGLQGEDQSEVISGLKQGDKVLVRSKSLVKKVEDPSAEDAADNADSTS